ncbi:hypothetical protein IM792_14710 [Mucilaginibacter sp. JRF]|uniref:putative sensor domain DACNV-containing protein n=1 Tax=Mucilaginibacter sp. JRF TaxID=2780088 RepID=UPI0018805532|nr:hypothetical protein [Mucilaginibacter sp. JRF]MBE9585705.1 hypothetical protein [Mucilaginibacter sp. JRF]
MKIATPAHLARYTYNTVRLAKTFEQTPPELIIRDLMEGLYFASMKTEEGRPVKVNVTFIDHLRPEEKPVATADVWRVTNFQTPLPFDIKTIVKLSQAADPWSSSLAVYYDENDKLWINGLIDQTIHAQRFIHHEGNNKPQLPGMFQTSIIGIGCLSVIYDYELIAVLRQNVLVNKFLDVLHYGPISEMLKTDSKSAAQKLETFIKQHHRRSFQGDSSLFALRIWQSTLSRLLLQVQLYHHGGAILITNQTEGLTVKYQMDYPRLHQAMVAMLQTGAAASASEQAIITSRKLHFPIDDYILLEKARMEHQEAENQLKGAIRFVAAQSCVDGLIVLNHQLEVCGFGAVIDEIDPPKEIYFSDTNKVTVSKLTSRNPDNFGTRHRSMMSYCWHHDDALGLVISQDGDLRAVKRLGDQLVIWENIKIQNYVKSKKIRHLGVFEKSVGMDELD